MHSHDPEHAHEHTGAAARSEEERLARLLDHWVEHNRDHVAELEKWAERARARGLTGTARRIAEAAGQLRRANASLEAALRELGGA